MYFKNELKFNVSTQKIKLRVGLIQENYQNIGDELEIEDHEMSPR